MAKLLCLCLLAVAATVGANREVQTLPAKGGRYSGGGGGGTGVHGVQTLPGNLGGGGRGVHGVQTLPGKFGSGIPPRTPQVQPKPNQYDGIPGNNLKPLGRPIGSSNRPHQIPPFSGSLSRPQPRPSKGGNRYRRAFFYGDDEGDSDEDERYRRSADDDDDDDLEYDDEDDDGH